MIERTFDNFDDCIIVLEEGREEIVQVTKLLIENMKDQIKNINEDKSSRKKYTQVPKPVRTF